MKRCRFNNYCPRGSSEEKPCPIEDKLICGYETEYPEYCGPGKKVVDNSDLQRANRCDDCPPGTFSTYTSSDCEICPAGYTCYGRTNTPTPTVFENHQGERCWKGHYCPEGTFEPKECPPGTFNPNEGMEDITDCQLCPPGTFQDEWGSAGCKVCGVFADSREGQAICECIGANRAYSAKDASCRCKSNFDYLDEDEQSKGNVSDLTDCFPLVYDNCKINGDGKSARQPDGTCVAENECFDACSGEPGTRSQILGVCSCANALNIDDICN